MGVGRAPVEVTAEERSVVERVNPAGACQPGHDRGERRTSQEWIAHRPDGCDDGGNRHPYQPAARVKFGRGHPDRYGRGQRGCPESHRTPPGMQQCSTGERGGQWRGYRRTYTRQARTPGFLGAEPGSVLSLKQRAEQFLRYSTFRQDCGSP